MKKKYAVFIRGINVSGKNIIRMEKLISLMESKNFEKVKTYIQSGNLVLESEIVDPVVIKNDIEKVLEQELKNEIPVIVKPKGELLNILSAISELGEIPKDSKLYVTLLSSLVNQKPDTNKFLKQGVEILKLESDFIITVCRPVNNKYTFPNILLEKEFSIPATTRNPNTLDKTYQLFK